MALIRIDHRPTTTKVNTSLHLIMPDNFEQNSPSLTDYEVLLLLHGIADDSSGWARYTNVEMLVRDKPLVVVMPSAARSFYTNMDNGQAYYSYIMEEMPSYLESLFHLDLSRRKMLIAGNSMGGFGAFKLAFLNPQPFRAALCLSGVLSLQVFNLPNPTPEQKSLHHEFDLLFGGLDTLPGSDNDPAAWLEKARLSQEVLPDLSLACGTEDVLLSSSRWFYQQAVNQGLPITYRESSGGHDWLFWGKQLELWLDTVLTSE